MARLGQKTVLLPAYLTPQLRNYSVPEARNTKKRIRMSHFYILIPLTKQYFEIN